VTTVVIVGGGPTASSLLERIGANAAVQPGPPVQVHLVDPYAPGTGRVWDAGVSPLVWMNSLAEDVTMFPDTSCTIQGPVRNGPSLAAWSRTVDLATLPAAMRAEIASLSGDSFPTRQVQTAYLRWFHEHVVATLPERVSLRTWQARAVDVVDRSDGTQDVHLHTGEVLAADVVVLAMGHLDASLDDERIAVRAFASRHGLAYLPPAHTVEQDLTVLAPGAPVVVLGFGQAFTDLLVLVTEGRGGRFEPDGDGFRYVPSGREPVLHVGSRRGVPYRSKISYRLQRPLAPLPQFLDEATLRALFARDELLDFDRDVWPLAAKEIGWVYYHELFTAHPDRTSVSWSEFSDRYIDAPWGAAVDELVTATVTDPEDRLDFVRLDRPLAGLRFDSADALHAHVRHHVRRDVERRTNPRFSADAAKFQALLFAFGTLGRIAASGRVTERGRIDGVGERWFSSFMYDASGPPPARLRQLLALADAGVVRFLGEHTSVRLDDETGRFVAGSTSHPDTVVATALVEAQIPKPSVERSADALVRALHTRGEMVEDRGSDETAGWSGTTGRVLVAGADLRIVHADGTRHPRRHALGTFTSRPAGGALARPRTNALAFRQHDAVARSILSIT
jgi:hypothetical protein